MLDIASYEESEYPEGTQFLKGDVRNRDAVRAALEASRPRWVIHGAAALPLWKRADIFSVNVEGTRGGRARGACIIHRRLRRARKTPD